MAARSKIDNALKLLSSQLKKLASRINATFTACEWINKNYPGGANYILSGNMDTDKKHSRANMLLTRGKRVVAECTIRGDL